MSWSSSPGTKTPALFSYAFLRELSDPEVHTLLTQPAHEVLVDSGGFTALNAGLTIELDAYIEWLLKWGKYLYGYVALDRLGDPATTDANLRAMKSAGLSPIPVHVRGDDERRMDELFEMSDYVALGGLRRPHRGQVEVQYVAQKMRWAKGRKVHWLGWTDLKAIAHFKPHSVDSSSWVSSLRYGSLRLYTGSARWSRQISKADMLGCGAESKLSAAEMLTIANAGVPSEWMYDPERWYVHSADGISYSNCVCGPLAGHSWVRYVNDVRRWWGTRHFIASLPQFGLPFTKNAMWSKYAHALYSHGRVALEGALPDLYVPPDRWSEDGQANCLVHDAVRS